MKRTLILLGLMLLIGVGSVFAQRGGGGGGRPQGGGGIGNRPSQEMPPQGTARNDGTSQRPNAENRNGGQGQGQGQGGDSAERHRNQQMEPGRLLKGLDLSREQKHQIKQIQKF